MPQPPCPQPWCPLCDRVGEAERQPAFLPQIPVSNREAGRPPLCSPSRRPPHTTSPSNIKTPPSPGAPPLGSHMTAAFPCPSRGIAGKGWSSHPPPCPAWHALPRAETAFLPSSSLPFPPKDCRGQQQSTPGSSQGRPCDRVSANEAGAGVCWEGLPFPKPGPPRAHSLSLPHCGSPASRPLPRRECQESRWKKPGLAPPSCWVGQGKPCALG